jgi:hypothetical protein
MGRAGVDFVGAAGRPPAVAFDDRSAAARTPVIIDTAGVHTGDN